ncbi:MAG TPA: DNA glycosylase [Candidatus Udaeobacter sp.]|jgi:N-glycosylase/DNA lyase|nr:DNA glycosylase [Candidatus Udaeobacter sp.]
MEIPAPDFNLAMTLDSGQVFHWEKAGGGFVGTIGQYVVYAEQENDVLKVRFGGTPKPTRSPRRIRPAADETRVLPGMIAHYFGLDHPLAEICESFPNDPVMNAARDFCCGLRIIRQPKWECLATFICSSMKQVAHIRQISAALRNRFGDQRKIGSRVMYTFPSPQRIARASESQLRECKLGYRAKNLRATAQLVSSGECDLESWSTLPDSDLRNNLCELPGVGAKIANCVMLFAYERLCAFPIDVWIERVLRRRYFPRRKKVTAQQLREFSEAYFGKHGGYAQQYLFHHARTGLRKSGVAIPQERDTALRSGRNDKRKNARITSRKTEVSRDSSTLKAFGTPNDRLAQVVSPAGLR